MDARGRGVSRPLDGRAQERMAPGPVIIVQGERWYYGSDHGATNPGADPKPPAPGNKGSKRPVPLDVTTDVTCTGPTCTEQTCAYTCARSCSTPCGPTYDEGGATCHYYPTCHVPGPTCIYQTCTGGTTCDGGTTCAGVSCTQPGPTCAPYPSCGTGPTCTNPTCTGTCAPALCPVTLFNVQVPRPGEIQMSFSSSSYLRYTLQCSTNLPAAQWTEVSSSLGNGGVVTLGHTNDAAFACYRLMVQTP